MVDLGMQDGLTRLLEALLKAVPTFPDPCYMPFQDV